MEIDDIAENTPKESGMDVESEEGELSDDDADITLPEPHKKPEIPEIRVFCPLVCVYIFYAIYFHSLSPVFFSIPDACGFKLFHYFILFLGYCHFPLDFFITIFIFCFD